MRKVCGKYRGCICEWCPSAKGSWLWAPTGLVGVPAGDSSFRILIFWLVWTVVLWGRWNVTRSETRPNALQPLRSERAVRLARVHFAHVTNTSAALCRVRRLLITCASFALAPVPPPTPQAMLEQPDSPTSSKIKKSLL